MKAVCWEGRNDVRVEHVPDPTLINPRDAIVRVTSTAICGSDLPGALPVLAQLREPAAVHAAPRVGVDARGRHFALGGERSGRDAG